ncbi:MFS transporter [Paraburkholderia sp. MM5477-R1]|uniref:MFS transporter n=1 Tax=Paraburkholderia sp. MM5477-R1 TaxID=2991062 RepID=UPI003D205376
MTIESRTIRKLMWWVVPILALGSVLQAFSQMNVAYAGLEMTRELKFTGAQFGFGSGIFFLTYMLMGAPSNLALVKLGARFWIALTMFIWGVLGASLALVKTPGTFYVIRLAMGAAEAGFAPTVVFIAGTWFPEKYRGRVLSLLLVTHPLAALIAAQISAFLLHMHGLLGLTGWQNIFVFEALPSCLLAMVVLFALPARVEESRWLSPEEQRWIRRQLDEENNQRQPRIQTQRRSWMSPRIALFTAVYFGVSCLPFGLIFFLPKIIQGFGLSGTVAAMLAGVPFAVGAIFMLLWGYSSDKSGERLFHAVTAVFVALIGCACYLTSHHPVAGLLGLSLTFGGVYAFSPVFWAIPTQMLSGTEAAAGLGIINGVGSISGILAPTLMGTVKDWTGSYTVGLLIIMSVAFLSSILLLFCGKFRSREDQMARPTALQ